MRLLFLLCSAASLVAWPTPAHARPVYGGSLRLAFATPLTSLDPAARSTAEELLRRQLLPLIFEGLVRLDDRGVIQPQLALSWQNEPDYRTWRFNLRPQVKLHNGQELAGTTVATALQRRFPQWKLSASGDTLQVRTDDPHPALPYELSATDAAIAVAEGDTWTGTGPFQVAAFTAGKSLALQPFADHWLGRPFLDRVEIRFNVPVRVQSAQFQAGSLDVAEWSLAEGRARLPLTATAPLELLLIAPAARQQAWRPLLNQSIDRRSLHRTLLQGMGEPGFALLPQWLSGYAFLFSPAQDATKPSAPSSGPQPIGYPATDRLAQLVAERVAFELRESGTALTPTPGDASTLRVRRLLLTAAPCGPALLLVRHAIDPGSTEGVPESSNACYEAERALLDRLGLVPLAHLPLLYQVSRQIQDWPPGARTVALPLDRVWLEPRPR